MNEILKEACDWQARLQSVECSQQELEQFDLWINTSRLHQQTYNDVSGFFSSITEAARDNQQLDEMIMLALSQGAANFPPEAEMLPVSQRNMCGKLNADKTTVPLHSSIAGVIIVGVGLMLSLFSQKVNDAPLIK